jgi:bifunctional DNase/RNase
VGALITVQLARLAVHTRTREPLALLVEIRDDGDGPEATDRCLVVSLRAPQAEVVAGGAHPGRDDDERLTQDLLGDLAAALGRRIAYALIDDLVDDRFHARLVLDDGVSVVARPSDALAVAVRDGLPVCVDGDVLDRVGQSFAALRPPPASPADGPVPEYEQVRELRRALEEATAEDFRSGEERSQE